MPGFPVFLGIRSGFIPENEQEAALLPISQGSVWQGPACLPIIGRSGRNCRYAGPPACSCPPHQHIRSTFKMTDEKATNVTWHNHQITREDRQKLNGHRGAVLWFTGLSGCGKSTIANAVDQLLHRQGVHTFVLDGDNIRMGLNRNLGFSPEDRTENIRRIGEVAKLFADAATIVSSAFISPYAADRELVRALLPEGTFVEILVQASIETCEARDPKGLYRKARAGEISDFTGIDAPYEAPESPEIILDSDTKGVEELANEVIAWLKANDILPA